MATILNLPEEVILQIFNDQTTNVQDFLNFSATCKHFHDMFQYTDIFWRRMFYKRWPHLKTICTTKSPKHMKFKELYKLRIQCKKDIKHCLSEMAQTFISFCNLQVPSFVDIDLNLKEIITSLLSPTETANLKYHFIIDELIPIVTDSEKIQLFNMLLSQNKSNIKLESLHEILLATHLLAQLKHYWLKKVWQDFRKRPAEQQFLEEAATFVAQWYHPEKDVSYSEIESILTDITEKVLNYHRKKYPHHPIFSTSKEQLLSWKLKIIDETQWDDVNSRQILNSISEIIFHHVFFINCDEYYDADDLDELDEDYNPRPGYLLDMVLKDKLGNLETLKIIYHSIARRLGIYCDVTSFPLNCVLRWKPKCDMTRFSDNQYFYIDIRYNGKIMTERDYSTRYKDTEYYREIHTLQFKTNVTDVILLMAMLIQGTSHCPIEFFVQDRWLQNITVMLNSVDPGILEELIEHPKYKNYNCLHDFMTSCIYYLDD